MTTTAVVFDGFSLIGVSANGGRFRVTGDIPGWLSRAVRRSREAKAQQDGDWPETGNVAGRPVTISGYATYDTPEAAALERRQMMALGGRGEAPLTVVDALGELTATVEVDSIVATVVRDTMINFTFALYACDPLLYGAETFASTTLANAAGGAGLTYPLAYPLDYGVAPGVTPGAVTVSNAGTATYWPPLRIDGPVPNPVITMVETGDWIRYGGTVEAGQWLDIDCANRRVLLNGQVSMRHLITSSGAWLAIPPGGGSITWSADAADPAASLSVWSYEGAWS